MKRDSEQLRAWPAVLNFGGRCNGFVGGRVCLQSLDLRWLGDDADDASGSNWRTAMPTSLWDRYKMESKIEHILDISPQPRSHHFGRPFMTPYQIAIEFRRRFPTEFTGIGKPLGGKGTGQETSLTQYIANELSKRIKLRTAPRIEGRFLARANFKSMEYIDARRPVKVSTEQAFDLSLFRLIDPS